ncbi:hypothetical protein GAMM_90028 [Gammaproteobacteria bacterium]
MAYQDIVILLLNQKYREYLNSETGIKQVVIVANIFSEGFHHQCAYYINNYIF